MPVKQSTRAEINTFVKGLITEASELNFPPNASAAEENFELRRDGTRKRRLGMNVEESHILRNTSILPEDSDTSAFNVYEWQEFSEEGGFEMLVVQHGQALSFFDLEENYLSSTGYKGTQFLFTGETIPSGLKFSVTSSEGSLIVVAGVRNIAVVSYNQSTGVFSTEYVQLKTRDQWGVQTPNVNVETDPSFRGPLEILQYYNNQNQSWGVPRRNRQGFLSDPQLVFRAAKGDLIPSNGEQVWVGMQFSPRNYTGTGYDEPFEAMYTNLYDEVLGADLKAAKGYFIIDVLERGQSRIDEFYRNQAKHPQLGSTGGGYILPPFNPPVDRTTGGAKCVAEFAGRVFFSGFDGTVVQGDDRSPNLANYVFFSQLVHNRTDIPKCYQTGDPTSRDSADLLDTDGGFLRISEAKEIIAMVPTKTELIVLASNGIWSINGGSDYGFSATNYKVAKISSFGCLTESSVVVENDNVYYWAEDAIYQVGRNQYGDLQVTNITLGSIQTYYDSIYLSSKESCFGAYDKYSKNIKWLYRDKGFMYEMVLDTSLSAFYLNKIYGTDTGEISVLGIFNTASSFVDEQLLDEVAVGIEPVFAGNEPVVAAFVDETVRRSLNYVKYLVVVNDGSGTLKMTFANYRDPDFIDFKEFGGWDAKAFCLTGTQTAGDAGVDKQGAYVVMHFAKTETMLDENDQPFRQSSCLMRGQWAFANKVQSNKWSELQQTYRYRRPYYSGNETFDNGFSVVTTKNKFRGRGKSFAMYFETEPLKDCHILGWNITLNANALT